MPLSTTTEFYCRECQDSHARIVYNAILSLYEDRLKPLRQEICRRVSEMSIDCPAIRPNLVNMCSSLPDTYIIEKNGDDGIIYLKNPPKGFHSFADCSGPIGDYSQELFTECIQYLLTLAGASIGVSCFQGGRHGLARHMKFNGNEQLQQQPLGVLSHIVQLLINAGVVAYEQNSLRLLVACCNAAKSGSSSDQSTLVIEDFPAARRALKRLLSEYPQGIQLAQLKSRLAQNLNVTLSPDKFGYSKLGSLLSDKLQDTVALMMVNKRLTVVAREKAHLVGGEEVKRLGQDKTSVAAKEDLRKIFMTALQRPLDSCLVSFNFWQSDVKLASTPVSIWSSAAATGTAWGPPAPKLPVASSEYLPSLLAGNALESCGKQMASPPPPGFTIDDCGVYNENGDCVKYIRSQSVATHFCTVPTDYDLMWPALDGESTPNRYLQAA